MRIPFKFRAALGRLARALVDPAVPLLSHVVVTRRCNLACGYCSEYDHVSAPVDADEIRSWIDHLGRLGNLIVTFTGGESLLHPELDSFIRRVNDRGMIATVITNGYPITARRIERLNDAGLTLMQVSVDNLQPTGLSQKSWGPLRPRMELLRRHARFRVNVNAVLGASVPEELRQLVAEVHRLGFFMTFGLLHDGHGQVDAGLLGHELASFFRDVRRERRLTPVHWFGEGWEEEMIRHGSSPWRCRAGARFLYIDEDGIVSWCSQQRGNPGVPLREYTREHLKSSFNTIKGCEDGCTINCVRRASSLDAWRGGRAAAAARRPAHPVPAVGTVSAKTQNQESL